MAKKARAPKLDEQIQFAKDQSKTANTNYGTQQAWGADATGKQSQAIDTANASRMGAADNLLGNAAEDRARYEQTYRPLEDQMVADAQSYNSPERQAQEAAKAQATQQQSFDAQRQNAQQNLESFGIDPSQTRSQALDVSARTAYAANVAAAGNAARDATAATGRAMRDNAINVGRADNTVGQSGTTLASNMQTQALGDINQGINTTAATQGTGMDWFNGAANANADSATLGTAQFNNQMAANSANKKKESGLGAAVGGIVGGVAGYYAGNPAMGMQIGAAAGAGMEDGGIVTDDGSMPPPGDTDTVPTMLAPGEYVIPADVVRHLGEQFFEKLKDKVMAQVEAKKTKVNTNEVRKMAGGGIVYQGAGNALSGSQSALSAGRRIEEQTDEDNARTNESAGKAGAAIGAIGASMYQDRQANKKLEAEKEAKLVAKSEMDAYNNRGPSQYEQAQATEQQAQAQSEMDAYKNRGQQQEGNNSIPAYHQQVQDGQDAYNAVANASSMQDAYNNTRQQAIPLAGQSPQQQLPAQNAEEAQARLKAEAGATPGSGKIGPEEMKALGNDKTPENQKILNDSMPKNNQTFKQGTPEHVGNYISQIASGKPVAMKDFHSSLDFTV